MTARSGSRQQFGFLIPALTTKRVLKPFAPALMDISLLETVRAVHQRPSSFLIFICPMLTVSVLILSLLVVAFPTQHLLYNF